MITQYSKRLLTLSFTLLLMLLLASCNSMKIQPDKNSSFISIKEGAWIEIKNELNVYPNQARSYLQGGNVISKSGLNLYDTDCEVEVRTLMESNQKVYPGKYDISKVAIRSSPTVWLSNKAIKLAMGGGRSSIDIKRFYQFTLNSKSNPEVMYLICRGPQDDEFSAELPTLEDIKAAVGNNIELYLF